MSKQKTLFSFFKKVPSLENEDKKGGVSPSQISCPKALSPKPIVETEKEQDSCCTMYQIVWAKLDGYPWWPALVCQDPDTEEHLTKDQVHVQFFDQPPSRSWISRSSAAIVLYKRGSDSDKRSPSKCKASDRELLKAAVAEADAAFELPIDERDSLLVDFGSSPVKENSSPGHDKENTDPPSEKRAKLDFDGDDDSGDEYKPGKDEKSLDNDDEDLTSPEPSESDDLPTDSDDATENGNNDKVKKRKRKPVGKTPGTKRRKAADSPSHTPKTPKCRTSLFSNMETPATPSTPAIATPRQLSTPLQKKMSSTLMQKMSAFKSPGLQNVNKSVVEQQENSWPHLKLPFIQPEKIMDKERRRPDHPDYDPRTLFVPQDFKNNCSPGMRQWWELKSDNWDTVLFFKVGKFYELYHMDAVIGVDELSLSLMRGEHAHSGFPEIAYGRFSTILVQKGYKVARVEQMETPDMMAERCKNLKKCTKFDKVVAREVCQVTSKGTLSHNVMDGEARDPNTNYLLALTEKDGWYGVAFIDVSIGVFHVGQFQDDKYLSRLRTLLSHCAPNEVIFEKRDLSERTLQLFGSMLAGVLQRPLQSDTEFWSASKTLSTLASREELRGPDGSVEWPVALRRFISSNDALGLTPADDGQLALRSLGACVSYLERSFLDSQLLTLKQFQLYDPVDGISHLRGQYLVLDDITLTNLEVLKNSRGGIDGTLLSKLDRCCTFPGKRLLRQWLCAPLADPAAIRHRQQAVEELLKKSALTQDLRKKLKSVPDLERLIAKIHSQGNLITAKNHPDSRAIFFEEKTYSKRKIQDFLATLSGFEKLNKIIGLLRSENPQGQLLQDIVSCPDLSPQLSYFDGAFDHDHARAEGSIIPKTTGIDPSYDAANEQLANLELKRNQYLKEQCAYFCVQVKYFGSDKNRYQLEIAEGAAKKAGPQYELTSTRKGFKRFMTAETKELLKMQMQAEEARTAALRDLRRSIFAQFGQNYQDWTKAVDCLSNLDVLMAIAEYARCEGETCLPEFVVSPAKPFVAIETGRHPCIPVVDGFIPNSIKLGLDDWSSLVLLTGPNMGGKSTLLRQLGLHVIMAHVGCRLPATSARLSPVDRVFTRIGAGDDILAGESTFFQELSETGLIIQHASERSVVLVDELGRGTSTYDGTAIAHAVLAELAHRGCLTLFSTHYHSLVEELHASPDRVSLGHMACATEGDTITFLYQFSRGACPTSHGFHAARLAGLPEPIISIGQEKAEQLVREAMRRQLFRKICQAEVASEAIENLAATIAAVL